MNGGETEQSQRKDGGNPEENPGKTGLGAALVLTNWQVL
jgi:hypothetical protein